MQALGPLQQFAILTIVSLLLLQQSVRSQTPVPGASSYTLSGTINSSKTGETLTAVTIRVLGFSRTAISNEYGFFSITLPAGKYAIEFSAVGFKTYKMQFQSKNDSTQKIGLEPSVNELETVNIVASAGRRNLESPQMGVERLNINEIRNIPVLLGEHDIIKTLQLLPGIKAGGEGNGGLFVRGGGADQNLILLDEAPVYNASHLLGFFSTFNSDALKNVTLYKSGMPAQYGGALSSVLDVKMNDGNNQRFGLSGGVGLISARLNLEGPIQKGKSSFLISARRTYADLFLKLSNDSVINSSRLYFYDVNAKANYWLGAKDRLFISGYLGKDVLASRDISAIDWGNATSTLRWNHIFSSKLFSNTSFIFSNYSYRIKDEDEEGSLTLFSQIRDLNLKEDLQWYLDEANTLSMGMNSIYHVIKPGEVQTIGTSRFAPNALENRYALENAIYISNTWKVSPKLNITYGMRLSAFSILGKGDYYNVDADGRVIETTTYGNGKIVKTYLNPEPRISAAFQLNEKTSVKASYVRNSQNLHLISNSNSASPTDRWVASTNMIKPETSKQLSAGVYRNLGGSAFELALEGYYKTLDHQIDYRNGADVLTNRPIETQLLYGIGGAYGVEFLFKKKTGPFSGWISYTLSKTERKIEGISNDDWYNARQDRTHDVSLVGMYQLDKKWTLSANWLFSTGNAVTYPNGKYRVMDQVYYYFSARNADRMPDYHRLDLGATRILKQTARFSSELTISIYNVYAHENAYQVNFRTNETDPSKTEAVQTTLFKFVPSISYNFRF